MADDKITFAKALEEARRIETIYRISCNASRAGEDGYYYNLGEITAASILVSLFSRVANGSVSGELTFAQALREIRAMRDAARCDAEGYGLPNELAEAKGRWTMAEDVLLILEQVSR